MSFISIKNVTFIKPIKLKRIEENEDNNVNNLRDERVLCGVGVWGNPSAPYQKMNKINK